MAPCVYGAMHIRRWGSEGERTSHLVKVSLPDIALFESHIFHKYNYAFCSHKNLIVVNKEDLITTYIVALFVVLWCVQVHVPLRVGSH